MLVVVGGSLVVVTVVVVAVVRLGVVELAVVSAGKSRSRGGGGHHHYSAQVNMHVTREGGREGVCVTCGKTVGLGVLYLCVRRREKKQSADPTAAGV